MAELTGVNEEELKGYLEDPHSPAGQETITQLSQATANPVVGKQLLALFALAKKQEIKDQCNGLRRSFVNRLKQALLGRSRERSSTSTQGSHTRTDYDYVNLEDEAREEAISEGRIGAIEKLIQAQMAHQDQPVPSGFGESSIPLCEGLKDQRYSGPRGRDNVDEVDTSLGSGSTLYN